MPDAKRAFPGRFPYTYGRLMARSSQRREAQWFEAAEGRRVGRCRSVGVGTPATARCTQPLHGTVGSEAASGALAARLARRNIRTQLGLVADVGLGHRAVGRRVPVITRQGTRSACPCRFSLIRRWSSVGRQALRFLSRFSSDQGRRARVTACSSAECQHTGPSQADLAST